MKPWEKDEIVGDTSDKPKKSAKPWEADVESGGSGATVGEYATGFSGGVNTGMANMAGAPVDITNFLLSKVGLGTDEPVGGSKWIKRQVGRMEPVTGEMFSKGPDTTGGRVINRIGEEVGASILPAGAMLKGAKGTIKAVKGTKGVSIASPAGTRGFVKEAILDPISRSPGKAAIGEGVAAVGAGTGAAIAREVNPGDTTSEIYGQIIGGFAPAATALTPTGIAKQVAHKIMSRFSTSSQKAAAQSAVTKALGGAMTDSAQQNLAKANKLAQEVPGFDPSLAEATGSQPLVMQQAKIEAEATGQFLDDIVARRTNNKKAIEDFTQTSAPEGDVEPSIVIDSANGRVKTIGETVDRLVAKNVQKQKDVVDGIATIDKMATGKTIRDGIQAAKTDASLKMSLRADELGINETDLTVQFQELQKTIISKNTPKSRFKETPSQRKNEPDVLKDIRADSVDPEEVKTTFQDIKAIRERISDELILAKSPGKRDRAKIRTLTIMKKDVDDFVKSLDSVLGENYATFRKEYFENYITPFESGAIFKSRGKDGTGFYRTLDEDTAGLFLDSQAAAKQYQGIFGNDQEMMAAMEGSVLDSIKDFAVKDGVIDPNKMKAWVARHKDALGELPSIKKAVDDIDATQNALFDRQTQLANRRKEIENVALVKQLTSYDKLNIGADKIIDGALTDQRKMGQLISFVRRDADASDALKRTVWEKITKGTSQDILISLDKNRASLNILFGKEHLDNIEKVASMKAMMDVVPNPQGSAFKMEPLKKFEDITGMAVPQAATRYWAFMSGRVPKYYLAFDIAKQALYKKTQRHFDSLMREALYDRKLAKDMAETVMSVKFPEKKAKRLGARLFALGMADQEQIDDNNQ